MIIFAPFIITTISGYLLASIFMREIEGTGPLERLFTGYGLGLGVLTFQMMIMGALGVPFTLDTISSVNLFVSAILLYIISLKGRLRISLLGAPVTRYRYKEIKPFGARDVFLWVLAAWIVFRCLFVFFDSISTPLYSVDTWSNWSAGAKLFFFEGGLLGEADEHYLGTGYRRFLGHPLHTPFSQVWLALWLGEFHEVYVKLWNVFYYYSALALFYLAVRREAGAGYALIMTFFLSSSALFTYHGTDALAELPLSYYNLASIVFLFIYMRGGNVRSLLLSGLLMGMGLSTKNEAILFIAASLLSILIFNIKEKRGAFLKSFASYLIPLVTVSAPWLIVKAINGIGVGHSGTESSIEWFNAPFGPASVDDTYLELIGQILYQTFLSPNFSLLFPFWIVVTAIGARLIMKTELKYLYVIVLTVISGYIFIYLTLEVTAVTDVSGIHRNILTYMPILFYTSSLVLAWLYREVKRDEGIVGDKL